MSLFTMITGAVSAIGAFITKAAPVVGKVVTSFAEGAIKVLSKISPEAVETVSHIVHGVAEIVGVKTEENPETLGAKAIQEENDKKMEDFDNNANEYISYLKNEVELDKEKFENFSKEEIDGCRTIGMTLETKAVEEKIGGISVTPECLGVLAKLDKEGINIDAKELVSIIQVLKEEGITNLNDVVDVLEGKGERDRIKTGKALDKALGENADEKIDEMKDAARKYEED